MSKSNSGKRNKYHIKIKLTDKNPFLFKIGYFIILFILCLSTVYTLNAEIYPTESEVLRTVFPVGNKINKVTLNLTQVQQNKLRKAGIKYYPIYDKVLTFFTGISHDGIPKFVCLDTVEGKWGPIVYMICISTTGIIENIKLISMQEIIGNPGKVKEFILQFIGKDVTDHLKLRKDIDGITGATVTSRAITNGVKKVMLLFTDIYLKTESKTEHTGIERR